MNVTTGIPFLILSAALGSCAGERSEAPGTIGITSLPSPAAAGSSAPHLDVTADGTAVLSWLEPAGDDEYAVRFSTLEDERWSEPVTVARDRGWFINWADFPSVSPITDTDWAAHWLVKRPGGTYAYDVAIATSRNGGADWAKPLTPHLDGTATEHGFVTLFPWNGGVGAVWLDGRNMRPDGSDAPPAAEHEHAGMSLRYARLSYDGEILNDGEVDPIVCDCCQTDVALTPSGPVLAYRGRTADEIRDILVTRHDGEGWSKPVIVGDDRWHIPGCPVNGPAIAAVGERVVVAWYTAPNRQSRVQLAWSKDGGRTFSEPVLVDDQSVSGKPDVVLLRDGTTFVIWTARSPDGGQLRLRSVAPDGALRPIQVVADGNLTRNSGFPQMIGAGDRLVLAWPEAGEPARVLTAYVPLD